MAALVPDKCIDKYDEMLGDQLRTRAYAARRLDVTGAWAALPALADAVRRSRPATALGTDPRP